MEMLIAEIATREEFLFQGPVAKACFYVLMFASMGYCAWCFWNRRRFWKDGKKITWKTNWLRNILSFILAQKKVRSSRPKSGAPMHLLIFYGFLSLLAATTILAINSYGPFKFHSGTFYKVYEMLFDSLGLMLVIGVLWAIGRRSGFRPKVLSHNWRDYWALGLLLALGVTGYLVEGARIAVNPKPWDSVSWVGFGFSKALGWVTPDSYTYIWWFHAILVAGFIASLPHMKLKHIVMAIATASKAPEWPMGQLQPISMEEVEQTGLIGVSLPNEYSQWHLMSLDACMECGRCTEVCPAHNVGKSLNPKAIVQAIHHASIDNSSVIAAVTEEALWACTTCNACVEACPVLIRHVDLIVDARRNLVAEGKLSGSAASMLRQTGSTSNAWGAPAAAREDWMKELEVPLAREKKEFDVLFWVGCAGATDPGAMKTTKATAQLMAQAGIDFACLGKEEKCTGDAARRVGDEFLFQEMAAQNVATFGQYKFKKIVTPCPHCLNTLANEYGEFGGDYEVQHHTQFLQELVETGAIKQASGESVTYHDPCYLGRVNSETEAPRSLIRKEDLIEPEHNGKKTLCCGAGGGRMWMEEAPDQRPGNRRAQELVDTGAKTIALGCPFCRIMLDASVNQVAPDEGIKLLDLAEMLLQANQKTTV
ncbi:MAG: 4Fe-4S dicluster domain-containing protein [Armatimonadetes bacterium]|nr:4Fe-4S dicluster domain-containing protein [Armatimonadota bacterium]